MGWVPVFNNDRKEKEVWTKFTNAFKSHPVMKEGGGGTTIRFGSLLGGSVDGCEELQALGLDERVYKVSVSMHANRLITFWCRKLDVSLMCVCDFQMSLENYRDLKERSFDRYRIGAQVLNGDVINVKPPNQEKMEKEAINKGEYLEAFRAAGGYPGKKNSSLCSGIYLIFAFPPFFS